MLGYYFLNRASVAVAAFLLAASPVAAQSTTAAGTQATGPSSQGSCTLAATDAWLCSNGAYCTWGGSDFSCVGGSGTVAEVTGPPGRTCVSHLDHFDCTDSAGVESTCELEGTVWVCESYASGEGESGAAASTCVVHGGHTHGDCSNQCDSIDLGEWNEGLHIASVFVLLIASLIGVFFPILFAKSLSNPFFGWGFFISKHFGTGVILSTCFIHLLYHSFVMFGNACLGELGFEPAAPAISLAALLVIFGFDYVFMRLIRARTNRSAAAAAAASAGHFSPSSEDGSSPALGEKPAREGAPVLSDPHSHSHGHHQAAEENFDSPQARMDVSLIEAGIIFHSIMIGVTLGASGGSQWIPLFCAIVFHQLFEGLALGTRIAQLGWPQGQAWRKWAMGGAFGLITPIGIAIGMGVHSSYNPNSTSALLAIGVLDAISAGILLYSGIVEMLVHDFMHGALATAGPGRVAIAFASLLAGALCMSVLGKWA